ncbi:hypothetical protein HPB51_008769 [Rhipicephalus microplus]|uniref:Uncharacterized protein n=1 Tax=Rhipicephalus microplus TaxID=6941 RepID=A0A9J6EG00_RHIMP|nr:hypothetical protein HPB51_008769 [Rhipicephalus microplus]
MELSQTESRKEQGRCEIKRKTKKAAGDADAATDQQATPASSMKPVFMQKVTQHVWEFSKASRMPNLPTNDYKIIVRPRKGFKISQYQKDHVHCCIRIAAGVGREEAEEDSVCLNERQNLIVGSKSCDRLGHRADVCPHPDDKMCRGCGCGNPLNDHRCDHVWLLCGKDPLTRDHKWKAK